MAEIISFTPRADLDARGNLKAFTTACRDDLTVFGADLAFDKAVWDIKGHIVAKARSAAATIAFNTWQLGEAEASVQMSDEFAPFAKAYIRYQQALRPTVDIGRRLRALQALELALIETSGATDPTTTTAHALNRGAQLAKENYSTSTAYSIGSELAVLSAFMSQKGLLVVATKWRNPNPRPLNRPRVGKEFDEARADKLPTTAALGAVAKIFRLATEPSDVVVSSTCAILSSAPDRISEVLLLKEDCETESSNPTTGEPIYGLRWWPAKGAEPMVKWVLASMSDVAREAIQNVRALSDEAREIAGWYEQNPERLYLPPHLEYLRGRRMLSMAEVAEMVFESSTSAILGRNWCVEKKITLLKVSGRTFASFEEIERKIIQMFPHGFPIANEELGLKYSEMLFVLRLNTMNGQKGTYRSVIEPVVYHKIASRLNSKTNTTIFENFGFAEDDGSPMRITTHQFRHYLNTLAQAGGLSQLDIAKWSGRKDIRQNAAYDHMSDRDVLALVRESVGDPKRMIGPLATQRIALIPRDEFARLKVPTAHTTEFGHCIHDFSMMPCQIHLDCVNCDEQVCVKGDAIREVNIRRHREETRILLEVASAAHAEGDFGADRWVAHQQTTLARLDQLCEILDDPKVPAGSVIQLNGLVPASRLQQEADRGRLSEQLSTPFTSSTPLPLRLNSSVQGGGAASSGS